MTCVRCSMSRPARGDVGGDEELGRARAQLLHDAVARLLRHAAVQRLGRIAARVERLGELLHLGARAAEDDRRGGRLEVEDAPRARPSCSCAARGRPAAAPSAPRPPAPPAWRCGCGSVALVALGDRLDARRHRRREEHRLAFLRRLREHRLDVLGEAHVEHLVGLVQHDHAHGASCRLPRRMWSSARPGVATTTSTPARSA
jgi:hypothetical protein